MKCATCFNSSGALIALIYAQFSYLPSGTALKGKENQLSAAVKELNARPRKCLAFATPEKVFLQEMEKIKSGALEI